MSEQESFQEKSHEATPSKKRKAKEQGTVLRSKELNSSILLMTAAISLLMLGENIINCMSSIMKKAFTLRIANSPDDSEMLNFLFDMFKQIMLTISPLFITIFILVFISPLLLGGWSFNFSLLQPKFNRLSPVQGIKKIFSSNNLMEVLKILLKFFLIAGIGTFYLINNLGSIVDLGYQSSQPAIVGGIRILNLGFILLICGLIVVACIDIPVQFRNYNQKIKMTTQEIKDESKENEGNPETKRRIRVAQREVSRRRMMQEVVTASVVIMNPEHFAVALRYEHKKVRAPIVVAKGVDLMALQIRDVAQKNKIEILHSPRLARAIYFNTKLYHEIPTGLYGAIAQVLAYIYQLNRYKNTGGEKPSIPHELEIPKEFRTE